MPRASVPPMPLTDAKIRSLKSRPKAYKVADFEGLFVLVKSSGSKSWRLKYRLNGKEKLLVIGDYPSVSLSQARKTRDAARTEIAAGIDPNESKQEAMRRQREKDGQTFSTLADAYVTKITKEGRAAATPAKIDWLLGAAKFDFGTRPMSDISSPMVLR